MKLEAMDSESSGGGSVRPKPVPLPRKSTQQNQNLIRRENQNRASSDDDGISSDINSNVPSPVVPPTLPARNPTSLSGLQQQNNKPVPLPRKLVQQTQRLTLSSSPSNSSSSGPSGRTPPIPKIKEEEDEDTLDYDKIPVKANLLERAEDPKRGTINIFKLATQMEDPFDTDFEKSIKEAEILTAITFKSPLNELDEETRKRFSTLSTVSSSTGTTISSSDDSDHYMEPPPARPVSAELAANLSAKRSSAYNNFRSNSCRLPTIPSDEDHFEPVLISRKIPLGKVVSCPPAPIENDDMYEPISTYSSSDSNSSGNGLNFINSSSSKSNALGQNKLDLLMPANKDFANLKRVTVPNIQKLSSSPVKSVQSVDRRKEEKSKDKFAQNKSKFDATAYDISDLLAGSTDSMDSQKRRSIASATESTDSFASFERNSKVLLRRSSSNGSAASSRTESGVLIRGGKKVHEYDDVAIEDGSVVFLNDSSNINSNTSSLSSDATNNNSSSSLTSRNSVIAEFDPLLVKEMNENSASAHSPCKVSPGGRGRKISDSLSTNNSEGDSSKVGGDRNIPVSSPLNLNDQEQHRYEYIDTDAEDSSRSNSTIDNNNFDEDFSPRSSTIPLGKNNSVDNPVYNPSYSEPFKVDFKSQSKRQFPSPLPSAPEEENSKENNVEEEEESYEIINSPPPTVSAFDFNSSPSPTRQGERLSPTCNNTSPLPDVVDSVDGKNSPKSGGGEAAGNLNANDASTSLVNQSSFFRRFSTKYLKIPLNSIREEKDKSSSGETPLSSCKKCLNEHPDNAPCKFRPTVRDNIVFSSNLYKPGGIGRKDFVKKRVVLAKGKLAFYNEKSDVISEIPMEKITVISKKDDHRVNPNLPNLKYFELGLVHWKSTSMVLAGSDENERAAWMQKYVEAHTTNIPQHVRSNFDRGGWCFMKEAVTSEWRTSWLVLNGRSLYYAYQNCSEFYEMDLRKARSIVLSQKEEEHKCPFVENQDVLTIDMICKILYIQTESVKVTSGWEKQIRAATSFNCTNFNEMQLTLDNVPVVVDKCIDFLYAHGILAEGIYRQSGSNTRISQLLSEFQKDAWVVQISPKEFSAHDVAGTLKRFFRTLPEPLVTSNLYDEWIKATSITNLKEKQDEYTRLLESLPQINYNIMKKLICHLYAVHELRMNNLMPIINLAPIWGPTLMNVDTSKTAQSYETACAECEVVKDLIENYYTLFRVDPQEIAREKKMQDALENFHLGSCRRKHSGDMKIWIYLWEKDETSAINVTLTPLSTAHGIVQQICLKAEIENVDAVSLHEVICQKALERPLHPSEKVIETVLRWSIWDVDERKSNFLILKKNTLYPALVHYAKDPRALSAEFKYADSKSKSFRKFNFQFSQRILKYSKDSKWTSELGSWKIEDIVWYIGCEPKRTPPTRWTFTFVKRNYPFKRSKEEPYFGQVISCSSEEELNKWIGAMVVGAHPEGLMPSIIV